MYNKYQIFEKSIRSFNQNQKECYSGDICEVLIVLRCNRIAVKIMRYLG